MPLHTYPPPKKALDRWLKAYPSDVENYGHLLLEQDCSCDNALISDFVGYFESAHADARAFFQEQLVGHRGRRRTTPAKLKSFGVTGKQHKYR